MGRAGKGMRTQAVAQKLEAGVPVLAVDPLKGLRVNSGSKCLSELPWPQLPNENDNVHSIG